MTYKSNDSEGDVFLAGIRDIESHWRASRYQFVEFLHSKNITTWHRQNYYVKRDSVAERDGKDAYYAKADWIPSQQGYEHGYEPGSIGSLIAITSASPEGDPKETLKLEVCKIIRIEKCIFKEYWLEHCYNLYVKYNPEMKKYYLVDSQQGDSLEELTFTDFSVYRLVSPPRLKPFNLKS